MTPWLRDRRPDLRRVATAVGRTARLMVGVPDYETYLVHHARVHPGDAPMDRRAFLGRAQARRFGGEGPPRCC